jgi:replicative superfamily II helicase
VTTPAPEHRIHGLFIGVDRYRSSDIAELRYAERDARALHALFSDTLGEGPALLVGEAATRAAIEEGFSRLGDVEPEDFVVIGFSGHGSETHELVTYDADVNDLGTTCVPLDLLTEWFKAIPARRLVCILDCCFSGAMGAKVLQVESKPRSLLSEAARLDQLAGDGRLILTASTANQPAWENPKIGHGLLTYFLLEALQGADEVRKAGKVSVYRLLEYVTTHVVDSARQFGARQEPTLRGTLDGELTWPVFTPGSRYRAAFPDRQRPKATEDISSLAPYGFPPGLLSTWAESIPSLNQLQQDAINEFGVLDGQHLVVSAPTSSGKTLVGELAALKGVLDRKRTLFLLPMKALVNDKYTEFTRKYDAFGLRVLRATGEISDDVPALMKGQYDVCLMTYEKCSALVLAAPHILNDVGTVVVDEVQMIVDATRGANLEFLLTLIRARRRLGADPQIVALSAVIGDSNGLERWLDARLLRHNERPVPLDEGVIRSDGSFRYVATDDPTEKTEPLITPQWTGKSSSQNWIIPLVRRLVDEGKNVIVFRNVRGATVGCATYLAQTLGLPPAQETIDALPAGDLSVSSASLRRTLSGGVAFHNSDLDRDERLVLEEHFRGREKGLRVIVATTTLAMGINTPAEAVIIVELSHPGPTPTPYSVAEYKNMVGRAGRLGYSEKGTSYVITPDGRSEYQVWQSYVLGRPEDVRSRLFDAGGDPRNLVLRTLAASRQLTTAGVGMTADEIVNFIEDSFGAFQQRQAAPSWEWGRANLEAAVADLARHQMIAADGVRRYVLAPLGRLAGESATDVTSIIRLVAALRDPSVGIDDTTLIALTQVTSELDDVYLPINRRSTNREPMRWLGSLQQQGVPTRMLQVDARDVHSSTLRAKKAMACLLWMSGQSRQQIETTLMQHMRENVAAGAVNQVRSRTIDLLPVVIAVVEVLRDVDLADRQGDLMLRVELGVPPDLLPIARCCRGRLTRAEYLRLYADGLGNVDALAETPVHELAQRLGDNEVRAKAVRELAREGRGAHQEAA